MTCNLKRRCQAQKDSCGDFTSSARITHHPFTDFRRICNVVLPSRVGYNEVQCQLSMLRASLCVKYRYERLGALVNAFLYISRHFYCSILIIQRNSWFVGLKSENRTEEEKRKNSVLLGSVSTREDTPDCMCFLLCTLYECLTAH